MGLGSGGKSKERGERAGGDRGPSKRSPIPVSSRCLPGLGEAPTAQSAGGSPGGAGLTRRSVKGAVREVVQSSNVQAEAQGLSRFPTGTQGLSYELKG